MTTTEFKETEIGMIPQEWEVLKLGEIYNDFNNKRVPLSSMDRQKRQWPYPYYWANWPIDYIDDYIFDWEYLLIWEDGSVITDNWKPYTQLVNWKFRCSNHAHVLQAKQDKIYSTKFLKYLLDNTDIKHVVTWAVQPKLNKWNLQSIEFWIPPLPEQQAIASILGSLDDKIELLREQNKTLEAMGQAIFKEWFGKYDIEDELPEGWKIKKVWDLNITITDYVANWSFESLKKNVSKIYEEENYALFVRNTDLKNNFSSKRYVDKEAYDFLSKTKEFRRKLTSYEVKKYF